MSNTPNTTTTSTSTSLYGAPRPKSKPIPLSSTSIHALSTELSHARSQLSKADRSAPARARPSKSTTASKSKLFSFHNRGVSARAARDARSGGGGGGGGGGTTTAELGDVGERDLGRSRRRLLEKARVYGEMKRGEVREGEGEGEGVGGLVDFDRKWVEGGEPASLSSSSDDDDDGELVEYEDEFGRTRTARKRVADREKRRMERAKEAKEEIGVEGVRPQVPQGVIYGNTIQTHAFQTPEFSTVPRAAELAAAMPTLEEEELATEAHYDATKEVRTKGVGFYQFSKDARVRKKEMEELERERNRTEVERKGKAEKRKRKREELEKRKQEVRAKRRGKVGGSWLEDQFGSLDKLGE